MKQHLKKNVFFYILILGLIGFAAYQHFDHGWAMSRIKDSWEDKRQELDFYTKQAMDSSNLHALEFATKTLVWAVRSELLSQNHEEINRYILELEKEQNIGSVFICDTAAIIQHASQKTLIGKPFQNVHDEQLLQKTTIDIEMGEKGDLYMVAPIMGLNNRIGTLFFTYHHNAPQINRAIGEFKIE